MNQRSARLQQLRRLLAITLVMLALAFMPILPAQAAGTYANRHANPSANQNTNHSEVPGTTASDLSDIPNLEQMDYDTFEEHIGDVPSDHKPLFNPDNPKVQIKDKTPGSDKTITTADLKENK
jgi:hypothetical protein